MSTALAIAGVTALLRDMLANAFAAAPVASAVGPVTVSSLPPDRVDLSTAEPTQVNVFLHQVSRNLGWANMDAPTRDARGQRVSAPPLALDLHLLITVYGAAPLLAEILLGRTAQLFHEIPVPTRAMIARALSPAAPPAGWPSGLDATGLADQFETLRITPEAMSNEEISKLWSALQARYRPTLAYRVTTVLIDSDLTTRKALPVQGVSVGATGQGRPRIDAVRAQGAAPGPVLPGSTVEVLGADLAAADMILRLGPEDLTAQVTQRQPDRLVFNLPDPLPTGLRAGALAVTVAHRAPLGMPPELREIAVSTPAVLVIAPRVTAAFVASASQVRDGVTLRDGTVTLSFAPAVGRAQAVALALNAVDGSGLSYSFRAPPGNGLPATTAEAASVAVAISAVVAGAYLIRVQVDAAETGLTQAADGSFNGPQVTI